MTTQPPTRTRPSRGDELELTRRLARLRRRRRRAARRLRRVRGRRAFPATACAPSSASPSAPTPRRARSRSCEPSADRIAPVADHPGAPWQVLPYERQLEVKQEQVDDALRRIGHARGLRARADRPRASSSGATATSSSTRSATDDGRRAGLRLPRARALGRDRRGRRLPAGLGGRQRGARADRRVVPRAGPDAVRPPHRRGLPAQPRRARGPAHRPAAGAARHQRRASSTARRWPRPRRAARRAAVDAARQRRRDDRRAARPSCSPASSRLEEELGELDLRISPEAFFQTNTEMAERLYGLAIEYAALGGCERVYDLYCGIGTIGAAARPARGRAVGPRARRGGGRRRDRQRARATRSTTPASSPATSAWRCASWSSAPAAPTCSSSTRRAPGSRRRSCAASSRPRPQRIVYVSCNPTTLAPNAAQLVEAGYELRKVRPVDMFPQTPHIECVARARAPD